MNLNRNSSFFQKSCLICFSKFIAKPRFVEIIIFSGFFIFVTNIDEDEEKQKRLGVCGSLLYTIDLQSNG